MPDLLEWTISHAPDPDEPPATPPPNPDGGLHARRPTRHIWLIPGGLIVGVVLGLGLFTASNGYWARQGVEHVIALEEQAALAGDAPAFMQLSESRDSSWVEAQARWASSHQAAPLPSQMLRPVRRPGTVQAVEAFAPNIVRAEVARTFTAPDGTTLAFSLAQFYRFNGEWKRIPPPADFWGDEKSRAGTFTDVSYYAADATFVETELGPFLDAILSQACQAWACPAGFKVKIDFTSHYANLPAPEDAPALPGDEPLVFALLPFDPEAWAAKPNPLHLPSPHEAGYPTDANSTSLLKHALAAQVPLNAAKHLAVTAPSRPQPGANAFFYALVARMAARLGLDSADVTGPRTADLTFGADTLWDMRGLAQPDQAAEARSALHRALAILNQLLQGQPPEKEIRLFQNLKAGYFSPDYWLSHSTGIPIEDVQTRLLAVQTYRVDGLPAGPYPFALGCERGPALFSFGEARPTYLLPETITGDYVISWSPDGRKLVFTSNQSPAVIDFDSGSVTSLPGASGSTFRWVRGWVSDSVLAYILFPRQGSGGNLLGFFDVAHPQRPTSFIGGVQDYVLSPDKSTAAVVLSPDGGQGTITLMPPLGGSPTPLLSGTAPAWSPESNALVYTYHDEGSANFSVRVVSLSATGTWLDSQHISDAIRTYTLQEGDTLWGVSLDFGVNVEALKSANHLTSDLVHPGQALTIPPGPVREILNNRDLGIIEAQQVFVQTLWSPTGEHIAVAAFAYSNGGGSGYTWLSLVRPDGSDLKWLVHEASIISQLGFSADGQFLAAMAYYPDAQSDVVDRSQTLIYDVATGAQSLALRNTSNYAWAPAGHQLAIVSPNGLALVRDPGDAWAKPQRLLVAPCNSVLWNPVP